MQPLFIFSSFRTFPTLPMFAMEKWERSRWSQHQRPGNVKISWYSDSPVMVWGTTPLWNASTTWRRRQGLVGDGFSVAILPRHVFQITGTAWSDNVGFKQLHGGSERFFWEALTWAGSIESCQGAPEKRLTKQRIILPKACYLNPSQSQLWNMQQIPPCLLKNPCCPRPTRRCW